MAYLFLSQHHKANAGEWSCETYCSKDYRGMCLSANVSARVFDSHKDTMNACYFSPLFITCCGGYLHLIFLSLKWYTAKYSCYEWDTAVAYKKQKCIETLGTETSNGFHMDWTLIKFVPSHLSLDQFTPFLYLSWLCAPSSTPAQNACWLPSKTQLTSERRVLGKSLLSDRVQCKAELLTCSDSWLALTNINGLQFSRCHCVLPFVWVWVGKWNRVRQE